MSSLVQPKIASADPEQGANLQVLRAVATFELPKGLIVLMSACGVLLLVRREDPWDIADGLLRLLVDERNLRPDCGKPVGLQHGVKREALLQVRHQGFWPLRVSTRCKGDVGPGSMVHGQARTI